MLSSPGEPTSPLSALRAGGSELGSAVLPAAAREGMALSWDGASRGAGVGDPRPWSAEEPWGCGTEGSGHGGVGWGSESSFPTGTAL